MVSTTPSVFASASLFQNLIKRHPSLLSQAVRRAVVVRMLAAIRLDDQAMACAGEIDDDVADRMLPPKPIAAQPAVAQRRPQAALGIRGILPQLSGTIARKLGHLKTLTRLRAALGGTLSRNAGEGLISLRLPATPA
jgi:hypothetical protein